MPPWYKRLIIQALIDAYDSWKRELDKLREPYYLKIWIFEKEILKSQVVASYRGMLDFYNNTFIEIEKVESLPEELTIKNLSNLSWCKGFDVIVWSEVEMLEDINDGFYTIEEFQMIKESAYSFSKSSDDTLYLLKNGVVWLGER